MGIHGIYQEIGKGERISFLKYAVQTYEKEGRPLRIAIDVSIWLFQIQASKGGTNPALRTFYYRLLRLTSHGIHPIFVFDGPNKPPFKRNKRTGPNVASIPEFLAKQLLKMFGFPIHMAPGEAEAECALLQREGIVDSVLTEDVDALMFGSGVTLRSWSPEQKSSKVPTHINLYDATKIENGKSGLGREGMILVALMSGGDYIPEGIPRCGPKTACEAARAGFGHDLCRLKTSDKAGFKAWRERLTEELHTNKSKYFKRKHGKLTVPDDFPRTDIMGYYTNPVVSSALALDRLKASLRWDQEVDFPALREFTGDAFAWVKLEGAKHFVRSLAPAMLVRELRIRAANTGITSGDWTNIEEDESKLVTSLHNERKHATTDLTSEIRVGFLPLNIVRIDMESEEPDDTVIEDDSDIEEEAPMLANPDDPPDSASAPKTRGPTKYDPSAVSKAWIPDIFIRIGIPLKMQDWEGSKRTAAESVRVRQLAKETNKAQIRGKRGTTAAGGMRGGEIHKFAKQTKPGSRPLANKAAKALTASLDQPGPSNSLPPSTAPQQSVSSLLSSPPATPRKSRQATLDRFLSPRADARSHDALLPLPEASSGQNNGAFPPPRRKRAGFQRTQTLPTRLDSPPPGPRSSLSHCERRSFSPDTDLPSPSQFNSKRSKHSPTKDSSRSRRSIEGLDLSTTTAGLDKERPDSDIRTLDLTGSSATRSHPRADLSLINPPVFTVHSSTIRPDPITVYSSPPAGPIPNTRKASPYLEPIGETAGLLNLHQDRKLPEPVGQSKDVTTSVLLLKPPETTPETSLVDLHLVLGQENDPFTRPPEFLKQFIRSRESMPGFFQWTDGTSPEAIRWKQKNQLLRNVKILDLTISPPRSTPDAAESVSSKPPSKKTSRTAGSRSRQKGQAGSVPSKPAKSATGEASLFANAEPVPDASSPLIRGPKRSGRIAKKRGVVTTIDLTL